MKNKLTDLNNHLFAQLERLGDEELSPEAIQNEVNRTSALVDVSDQIIKNAALHLKAAELSTKIGSPIVKGVAPMIEDKTATPDYGGNKI